MLFRSHTEGNILLTTGSKTLDKFVNIPNYQDRLAIRVLPMLDSLEKALTLGYKPSNIICMQGPFSEALNIEFMRRYNTKFMVTKDSGNTGGFDEKVTAVKKVGAKLIVINREEQENGDGYFELLKYLQMKFTNANIKGVQQC